MLTLYYHPLSFPAFAPIFTAEYLKLDYDRKLVDLVNGEHKTPEYLAINSYGKVPALKDGDFTMAESHAIMRYLARRADSDIYGGDAKRLGEIDQWMDFVVHHIRDNIGRLQFNRVVAPMIGMAVDENSVKEGVKFLLRYLPMIEGRLSENKYLCGDDLTIADLALLAALEPSETAQVDLSECPTLKAWLTAEREMPYYQNVHSHFMVELGR